MSISDGAMRKTQCMGGGGRGGVLILLLASNQSTINHASLSARGGGAYSLLA